MTPWQKFEKDYHQKKVLILGLGIQGRGVGDAKIFAEIGSQVTVADLKTKDQLSPSLEQLAEYPIAYQLGPHRPETVDQADVIVRNASVPWKCDILEHARSVGKPIVTDESLFFTYAQPSKTIGITGTRGKSTTTHLIFHLMKSSSLKVVLAGNAVATPSLALLQSYDQEAWYVFELSSWQLQGLGLHHHSPHISVFTNLYPDHLLDRTFDEYGQDKAQIFLHQKPDDYLVANRDNQVVRQIVSRQARSQVRWFASEEVSQVETSLIGEHNRENIAAAYKVAQILNLHIDQFSVSAFGGLPMRLEKVGNINGVEIINDTTSTTPTATTKALAAYPDSVLILGGTTKKLPLDDLVEAIKDRARQVVLLDGSGTSEIEALIPQDMIKGRYSSLPEAVDRALSLCGRGDRVLFSPGFTSFGMFANEFDRGEKFNQLIKEIQGRDENN